MRNTKRNSQLKNDFPYFIYFTFNYIFPILLILFQCSFWIFNFNVRINRHHMKQFFHYYKTIKVWRKQFTLRWRHEASFNGKVRSYYICKNSGSKKVSVSLKKLKHLSSWARSVITYLLMWDSGALTEKETDYGLKKNMFRRTRRWYPKIQVKGISTLKRLCTSRKRKFNSNLARSLNRSFNPPKISY